MQPGWYDDPFARGWMRWWDGTSWTSHQAPVGGPPAQPVMYGMWAPSAQQDLVTEQRWARFGRWAIIAVAVLGVISYVIVEPLTGHWLRQLFDTCRADIDSGSTRCNTGQSRLLAIDLAAAPTVIPQLLMMVWLFQVAKIARRLGLPARRDPGWAFGFLVPIVNFWFPYQVAADSQPPRDPRRTNVGWWWAFWLVQSLAAIPVVVVAAVFSTGSGVLLGLAASVLPVLAAWFGYRMVGDVLTVHQGLLAGR
jgi:hypothetical protein